MWCIGFQRSYKDESLSMHRLHLKNYFQSSKIFLLIWGLKPEYYTLPKCYYQSTFNANIHILHEPELSRREEPI